MRNQPPKNKSAPKLASAAKLPDKRDTSTWRRYRKGMCSGCWATCCTYPVKVNSEDLFHMGFIGFDEVNGPLLAVARRLQSQGVVQKYFPKTRNFLLAQKPNQDCVFLTPERLCSLYERRPAVCREFPYNSRRPGYCPKRPLKHSAMSLNVLGD